MGWNAWTRRLGLGFIFFGYSLALAASPVYRVVYSDDEILKKERVQVEKVYGARVHVVPAEGEAPKHPTKLEGIVVQVDPDFDRAWVVGTRNPLLEYIEIQRRLQDKLGLKDIDEKWDEYRFLEQVSPSVMPPEMHLGSEFDPGELDAASLAAIADNVERLLAGRDDTPLKQGMIQIEAIRKRVNDRMGKSIFKVRDFNHSEGKLPKTNKNWAEIYLQYYVTSRPKVKALEKEIEGTSRSLEHEVVDLPHIEGRALEVLIEDASRTIVQKMIPIKTEMRMHIVEGKIIEGGSFLRFYPLGKFLTKEEIARVEAVVRKEFLEPVVKRFGRFSCTPDVVVEESGKVRILDMNSSMQSGYYYPDEGIFMPSLFAAALSGEKTPLLEEWDYVVAGRMEGDLTKRVRDFKERYDEFITDYNSEQLWDRVLALYIDELKRKPTSNRFALALFQLQRAGLRLPAIFYQFVSEAQSRWPELRLPAAEAKAWAAHFESLNPKAYRFRVDEQGRIVGEEIVRAGLLFHAFELAG